MCAALYAAHTNFGQFLPGEHETASFPLTLQPTTRPIDKGGRNIKRGRKIVLFEDWERIRKKISETIVKRDYNRLFRQDELIFRSCIDKLCDSDRCIIMLVQVCHLFSK